jgi:hypothetical protein
MRAATLLSIAVVAITAASCDSIPQQGFAMRYFGGPIGPELKSAIVPATDFSGQPVRAPVATAPGPTSDAYLDSGTSISCESVAQHRAADVSFQGYDETVQKSVHDAALSDCQTWRARH